MESQNASRTIYPARGGPRPITADDIWSIPRVGGPAVAADGKLIAVPVTTYDLEKNAGTTRIWLMSANRENRRPLTGEDVSSDSPAFSPDGRRIAFVRKDANGKGQIHLIPVDGGEASKVTDLPLGAFDPHWTPDGQSLVFGVWLLKGFLTPDATKTEAERREKDPVKAYVTEDTVYRFWDTWLTTGEVPHLFHLSVESKEIRDLTPDSTLWFEWMSPGGQFDISPEGDEVAISGLYFDAEQDRLRSSIFTVPIAGGELRRLTSESTGDEMRARYSPDGKTLVFGRQEIPDFYADRVRLMRWDRASGKGTVWLGEWDRSPSHWSFANDGTLYFEAEDLARGSLFSYNGDGDPSLVFAGGTAGGLEPAASGLFFTNHTISRPPEVYRIDGPGSEAVKVTDFTGEATAKFGTGEVREIEYAGAHGETVQMFVVLPPGYQEGKRYPLVQLIHGGPHGINGDTFHFRWNNQLFAAPGYVVALVNFQGSTSWGQDFAQRIQGGWGDRPYDDIMLATDHLIAAGLVDETRMAATGGSYGGYMAAWIAGHTDRFRCIVNHAGVYDLQNEYAGDITRGLGEAFGGTPWENREGLDAFNPARFAENFKTPMLIIHGGRDYRVPADQGLVCYGVLKAKGVPARLVFFPDENHWVLKPKNSLLWYREVHAWLDRYLNDTPVEPTG